MLKATSSAAIWSILYDCELSERKNKTELHEFSFEAIKMSMSNSNLMKSEVYCSSTQKGECYVLFLFSIVSDVKVNKLNERLVGRQGM